MIIEFSPQILYKYFNAKTIEACKSCKRYNQKACCPPNIQPMWYWQLLLPTYEFGKLVIEEFKIDFLDRWIGLGKKSSLDLNKQLDLLQLELKNFTHIIRFGGGSCKYCSKICKECKHPDKMLIPIEATGLDVVKLVKDLIGLELKFPVKDKFFRVGMILWDTNNEE